MFTKLYNVFKNDTPTIRFVARDGAPNVSNLTQVRLASSLSMQPEWLKNQKNFNDPTNKFFNCPGMVDWYRAGYIIPAWANITFKANKMGSSIQVGSQDLYKNINRPTLMNSKLVEGITNPVNVKFEVHKVPTPWAIFTKPGYSVHCLPAFYHSDFLDKIALYPGTIDYDNFHVCNFVFSALKECEFVIPVGAPLIHVIPYKREVITGVCQKATEQDRDEHNYKYPIQLRNAYRKFFHSRKSYSIEVIK